MASLPDLENDNRISMSKDDVEPYKWMDWLDSGSR